jgi:hypothetical protein
VDSPSSLSTPRPEAEDLGGAAAVPVLSRAHFDESGLRAEEASCESFRKPGGVGSVRTENQ